MSSQPHHLAQRNTTCEELLFVDQEINHDWYADLRPDRSNNRRSVAYHRVCCQQLAELAEAFQIHAMSESESSALASRRWRAFGSEAETRMMGVKGRLQGSATSLIQMRLFCDTHSGLSGFFSFAASRCRSAPT